MPIHGSLRLVVLLGFIAGVGSAGCTSRIEPSYALADATKQIPGTHQQQISLGLQKYFGTPYRPVLKVPSGQTDEKGEPTWTDLATPERLRLGAASFARRCAGCHGETGDGAGEAAPYLQPRPRDYRGGVYKFTSTGYGMKPHRNDLIRLIRQGAKGTSMPSFKFLPDEELQGLVDYVIMLSYRGEAEQTLAMIAEENYEEKDSIQPQDFVAAIKRVHDRWEEAHHTVVFPATAQPRISDETILAGRKAFLSRGCAKCHGEDGKGQTAWLSPTFIAEQEGKPEAEREKINYDQWKHPAPAADLTAGTLHGGRRPLDIYRRIYNGINGTPMPGFRSALEKEPDTVWHLAHYVLSVVENRKVDGLDAVKADPVPEEGGAPATPEPTTPEPTTPEPAPATTESTPPATPAAAGDGDPK